MQNWRRTSGAAARLPLLVFLGFLIICMFGGGASRADVQSQMIVRIAAILMMMVLLIFHKDIFYRPIRAPLLFLLFCAAVVGSQLIPLPPEMWESLPGRGFYADVAPTAGLDQPSRPLSLTPDLTLNSLLSLIPPLGATLAIAALSSAQRQLLLPIFIGVALASACLGILQISDGGNTFVLYRIWSEGLPVGLFANRNHQAALIAIALPMVLVWAALPETNQKLANARPWIALGVIVMLCLFLLVLGSRAGLFLGGLGLLGGALITIGTPYKPVRFASRRSRRAFALVGVVSAVMTLAAAIFFSRAAALDRLEADATEDLRFQLLGPAFQMVRDFLPFGAGFGSFDPVFRRYETFDMLRRTYLNHAHNDLLELLSDAGIFGLFLLLLFLGWYVMRSVGIWRRSPPEAVSGLLGRLGALVVLLLLLASLVDYPLRTPLLAVVFTVACGWMCFARRAPFSRPHGRENGPAAPLAAA